MGGESILIILVIMFATSLAALIWLSNNWLNVKRVNIGLKKLPVVFEGFRLVLLSDLHSSIFGKDQDYLLRMVAQQQPDIIAFAGDLIDGRNSEINKALRFMENLMRIAPVYYVEGNHEVSSRQSYYLFKGLKALGVNRLFNEWTSIGRKGNQIIIAGVGDAYTGRTRLDLALKERNLNDACILLTHNPDIMALASQNEVDLVLAGHYHGGQIRIPFLPAIISPSWEIFPRYDSGLYRENDTSMYLTRGLGHTGPINFRFWNRPEIILITLTKSGIFN